MDDSPLSMHIANTVAALRHLLRSQAGGLPRVVRPPRPPEPVRVAPPAAVRTPPAPSKAAAPPTPVPRDTLSLPEVDPWPDLDLAGVGGLVAACTRCDLASTRTHTVFGEGALNPPVMFIGEGPGAEEDKAGRPFVGPAGQLLDSMIRAMGLTREACYIANVVKCRPPNNAVPRPDQAGPCMPYLFAQIRRVQPRFIVALGATAAKALFGKPEASVGRLRGRLHQLGDIPLVVTYHPAALLRDPGFKRPTWEDLKLVMARLKTGDE